VSEVSAVSDSLSAAELARSASAGLHLNMEGNFLIADQFNNRVIEVDAKGAIVWSFGNGPDDVTAASVIAVNDAERVGPFTLMAGTGAPAGTEPACPDGCVDSRVLVVDRKGHVVWQYGQFGVNGDGPDQLNAPVQATWLPGLKVLITDQGNQRVIEVGLDKKIHWQYGTTGVAGNGPNQLNAPNSAQLLPNGNVLISDEANNRAIEVTRDLQVAAEFTAQGTLNGVAFASRLRNGHTLISDANNNRIVEVDRHDQVVWQYATNTDPGSNPSPAPTRAVRLRNGDTLISDQFNHRVIAVDRAGHVTRSFGNLNVAGYGTTNASEGLNGPYDAKVVGDFTGLTNPFERDD
jgi:hypothetical protein